jgi:hypothetical protein
VAYIAAKNLPAKKPTQLTASDRFVANWLVERITSLPDEVHEKLTERLAIQEEGK